MWITNGRLKSHGRQEASCNAVITGFIHTFSSGSPGLSMRLKGEATASAQRTIAARTDLMSFIDHEARLVRISPTL